MITNIKLRELDEPSLFRELSFANIECANKLVRQMTYKRGALPQTIHHANVILSLIYHGVELFLKYAIAKRGVKVPGNHYIRELNEIYKKIYPEKAFRFDVPFITEYLGFSDDAFTAALNEEKKRKNEGEQIYRYHTDKTGKPWEIGLGFKPTEILKYCINLQKSFNKIDKKLHPKSFERTEENQSTLTR
jgi:hypothetical protein